VYGSCERDDETTVSIKWGEFLDQKKKCKIMKKGLCPMELVN
jgi:hypothetical protein